MNEMRVNDSELTSVLDETAWSMLVVKFNV